MNKTPIVSIEEYASLEAFVYAAKRWKLDFKKISTDPFRAQLKLLDYGDFQIGETMMDGIILQNGHSPEEFRTIIIPGDQMQYFKWQNYNINSDYMLISPWDNRFTAISNNNFHVYTISISEDYFQQLIQIHAFDSVHLKYIQNKWIYPINKNYLLLLNSYLDIIFRNLLEQDKTMLPVNSTLISKLPEILLGYIDRNEASFPEKKERKRDVAVSHFLEHYNVTVIPQDDVREFCHMHSIPQQTLEKGIQEYFNTTPAALIHVLKLNQIRSLLLNQGLSLEEAVHACHLKNVRQLSKDYQALFHELPEQSKTELGPFP